MSQPGLSWCPGSSHIIGDEVQVLGFKLAKINDHLRALEMLCVQGAAVHHYHFGVVPQGQ